MLQWECNLMHTVRTSMRIRDCMVYMAISIESLAKAVGTMGMRDLFLDTLKQDGARAMSAGSSDHMDKTRVQLLGTRAKMRKVGTEMHMGVTIRISRIRDNMGSMIKMLVVVEEVGSRAPLRHRFEDVEGVAGIAVNHTVSNTASVAEIVEATGAGVETINFSVEVVPTEERSRRDTLRML